MKTTGGVYFFVLAFLLGASALETRADFDNGIFDFCATIENQSKRSARSLEKLKTPIDGGIREQIPEKYRARYEKWKNDLLSTEFGRAQWNAYAENKNFVLKIKISGDEKQNAGTSDYEWDEQGNLIGATITLGSKIDRGFPNPIYFPVVNSLSLRKPTYKIGETILAAAKFAHEFGHIQQTAKIGGATFRQQNRLIDEYNEIFRAGGYGLENERLLDVQKTLGGTPVEIWENREYWGETNAMRYLVERLGKEEIYCSVIGKIESNVKTFAVNYEDRFMAIIESSDDCGD